MEDIYKMKADILTDALPYMQDFDGKIMVIQYSCNNIASLEEEKKIMQDIALLHFLGVHPIIVHSAKKGTDIFRENKRIASLLETNNLKAIGICGIDLQTLSMMIDNHYIPVVMPNDIQTEDKNIYVEDVAREIAIKMKADKLIFMSKDQGLLDENSKIISIMSVDELIKYNESRELKGYLDLKIKNAIEAIRGGVHRVHIINGMIEHSILVELFSVSGIGTAILDHLDHLYKHELKDL